MSSSSKLLRARGLSLGLLAALAASGCATLPTGSAQASAASAKPAPEAASAPAPGAAASAPGAAGRPDPAAPKPFDEVVKGAKLLPGLIPMWQKDEKVWLELRPEDFG